MPRLNLLGSLMLVALLLPWTGGPWGDDVAEAASGTVPQSATVHPSTDSESPKPPHAPTRERNQRTLRTAVANFPEPAREGKWQAAGPLPAKPEGGWPGGRESVAGSCWLERRA